MKRRKCSFRYLWINNLDEMFVVTQDMRRSINVITGFVSLGKYSLTSPQYFAKLHGCSVIVRLKRQQG